MEYIYKEEEFQQAIKDSKLSQTELAERTGISQGMISMIISGNRGFSYLNFIAICKAIDTDPENFLTEKGKKALQFEKQ